MKLKIFIDSCREEMKRGNIARFIELRYDVMNRLFPHRTFSVEEAGFDFFEKTANYLSGAEIPANIESEYSRNYFNWIKQNL